MNYIYLETLLEIAAFTLTYLKITNCSKRKKKKIAHNTNNYPLKISAFHEYPLQFNQVIQLRQSDLKH